MFQGNGLIRYCARTLVMTVTLLVVCAAAHAADQGARFSHTANPDNIETNHTHFTHPLTDLTPSAIVHATHNFKTPGSLGVSNYETIGVFYDGSAGMWAVFNQRGTSVALPEQATFNVWIPPADGTSFVQVAEGGGNHVSAIDNPLVNGKPDVILQVTQSWNPGGGSGVYNDHEIGVFYYAGVWGIINLDLEPMATDASFNVTVLPAGETSFVHTATAGNSTLWWTEIDHPNTNGNPNAIISVTKNFSTGVVNDHPIGVWYVEPRWRIYNQDINVMEENTAYNVTVLPQRDGLRVHRTNADNTEFNCTLLSHPLTNGNPHALAFATQNWNPPGSPGVYNPHPIGVWYDGLFWSVFNQDDATYLPINAAFNIVVPPVGANAFLHTADADNTDEHITVIDHPATNGDPNAILQVTQNWNPSGVGDTYNDHPIGVYYSVLRGSRWTVFNEDIAWIQEGASFNVWVPPSDASTFVHEVTAGNADSSATVIDNPVTNGKPELILIVTQNWNPGGSVGDYNPHPIGVYYYDGFWRIFNEDSASMPVGVFFNVTVMDPEIFSDGFESGNTSAWSSVAP